MKRKIIFLVLLLICLVSCSNKTVLEEYTGEYFDYNDFNTYLAYHGFVVDSMNNNENLYTYTIGDNEYELIVLNNIKYSLKAYPVNLLFKDKEGSINLYDKYYVFDNLLLSKNTDKTIRFKPDDYDECFDKLLDFFEKEYTPDLIVVGYPLLENDGRL